MFVINIFDDGYGIINLQVWNKICMAKLLWNLCRKADSLWVRWIHSYYIKKEDVRYMRCKDNGSWVMKQIMKSRSDMFATRVWNRLESNDKFHMKSVYCELLEHMPVMPWHNLISHNKARPRAVFILWLACNKRLATKDRLAKMGFINDRGCQYCNAEESVNHLLFGCRFTNAVWKEILNWINIGHDAKEWDQELCWVTKVCKSRNWRSQIVKVALAETVYEIWWHRNNSLYSMENSKEHRREDIEKKIIDNIVNRIWIIPKYRKLIAQVMCT